LLELKEKLNTERTLLKEYKMQIVEIKNSSKTKKEQEDAIKLLERPKLIKFKYKEFRDIVRKYKYIETPFSTTTDGRPIVLSEFIYDENNNEFPYPVDNVFTFPYLIEDEFSIEHNRIPRGAIFNFISSLNSMIANYRNNEREFDLKMNTKKSKLHTIYFEDDCYPKKFIDSITNKYCYTTSKNGVRKRVSISLNKIKEYTKIHSMIITHDTLTGKIFLYLSVPIDFYLPSDKRLENQKLFITGNTIALDPGIRTFITGYTFNGINIFGDGCCSKIFELLRQCDSLSIFETMTDDEKHDTLQQKQKLRDKIKNMVEDLHWKVINHLVTTYSVIIYPDFRPQGMLKNLSKENKRKLSSLSFFKFKERLIYKCKANKRTLIIMNESYTSRTCCNCGFLNNKNSLKTFKCHDCKYEIDRDINGARNIMIKVLTILKQKTPDIKFDSEYDT
jgi:putative transposase